MGNWLQTILELFNKGRQYVHHRKPLQLVGHRLVCRRIHTGTWTPHISSNMSKLQLKSLCSSMPHWPSSCLWNLCKGTSSFWLSFGKAIYMTIGKSFTNYRLLSKPIRFLNGYIPHCNNSYWCFGALKCGLTVFPLAQMHTLAQMQTSGGSLKCGSFYLYSFVKTAQTWSQASLKCESSSFFPSSAQTQIFRRGPPKHKPSLHSIVQ